MVHLKLLSGDSYEFSGAQHYFVNSTEGHLWNAVDGSGFSSSGLTQHYVVGPDLFFLQRLCTLFLFFLDGDEPVEMSLVRRLLGVDTELRRFRACVGRKEVCDEITPSIRKGFTTMSAIDPRMTSLYSLIDSSVVSSLRLSRRPQFLGFSGLSKITFWRE